MRHEEQEEEDGEEEEEEEDEEEEEEDEEEEEERRDSPKSKNPTQRCGEKLESLIVKTHRPYSTPTLLDPQPETPTTSALQPSQRPQA